MPQADPPKPILLTLLRLPPRLESRAQAEFEMRHLSPARLEPAEFAEAAEGAAAVLCAPGNRVDAGFIAALPSSVQVIGTFSVGYDHIDVAAAAARGIAVVHTPGVLSRATAEFTMLLMLSAARRSAECERLLRAGGWKGWLPAGLLGRDVSGRTLGIFGMGRIGQELARMAAGFQMRVHYHNRARLPAEIEAGATYHETDSSLLAVSEFLALCAPASPETRHWLNAGRIAQLPERAIVVNTARGSLVDDDALIAALTTGRIAAAGLDVFIDEPRVPAAYLGLENVVLTPHIASGTEQTRDAMGDLALDGIADVLAGRQPIAQVQ